MRKVIGAVMLIGAVLISISGCKNLDIVAKDSVDSFSYVLETLSQKVEVNNDSDKFWTLKVPDNSASLYWKKDLNDSSEDYDIYIVTSLAPFIDAGLDRNKFIQNKTDNIKVENNNLIIGINIPVKINANIEAKSPIDSFKNLVLQIPAKIGWHAALNHYGLDLGYGFLFEWAKDIVENDKDIVFVLDPEIFIKSGVNEQKVKGWVFGEVTIDDEKGKPIKVNKFLKPFNLKL
jgi:hypothetical protein